MTDVTVYNWFLFFVKPLIFPLQNPPSHFCVSVSALGLLEPTLTAAALPGLQGETKACEFTVTLATPRTPVQSFSVYIFLRRLNCFQISNFFLWAEEVPKFRLTAPSFQALVPPSLSGSLFTGVARNTLNLPQMWLSVILSIILCMLPVIGYQFLKPLFWPVSVDQVSATGIYPNRIYDPLSLCLYG